MSPARPSLPPLAGGADELTILFDCSYMFDEPSSYLDVKQRLNAARVIRSLTTPTSFVIAVEHDLSVLDYLSDYVCVLYGTPSAYGVVTMPFSVREGSSRHSPLLIPSRLLSLSPPDLGLTPRF